MKNKINVFCGFYRTTIVKAKPSLVQGIFLKIKCLECDGSGIFDCGIPEERGVCVRCKGSGAEYVGTV